MGIGLAVFEAEGGRRVAGDEAIALVARCE
jgi:hypothetical protein